MTATLARCFIIVNISAMRFTFHCFKCVFCFVLFCEGGCLLFIWHSDQDVLHPIPTARVVTVTPRANCRRLHAHCSVLDRRGNTDKHRRAASRCACTNRHTTPLHPSLTLARARTRIRTAHTSGHCRFPMCYGDERGCLWYIHGPLCVLCYLYPTVKKLTDLFFELTPLTHVRKSMRWWSGALLKRLPLFEAGAARVTWRRARATVSPALFNLHFHQLPFKYCL